MDAGSKVYDAKVAVRDLGLDKYYLESVEHNFIQIINFIDGAKASAISVRNKIDAEEAGQKKS